MQWLLLTWKGININTAILWHLIIFYDLLQINVVIIMKAILRLLLLWARDPVWTVFSKEAKSLWRIHYKYRKDNIEKKILSSTYFILWMMRKFSRKWSGNIYFLHWISMYLYLCIYHLFLSILYNFYKHTRAASSLWLKQFTQLDYRQRAIALNKLVDFDEVFLQRMGTHQVK